MKYVLVFIFIKKKNVLRFAPQGSNPGSVPIYMGDSRYHGYVQVTLMRLQRLMRKKEEGYDLTLR